jgi:dipeptidyl aminopeptidase/acylaminoacyl peptidase
VSTERQPFTIEDLYQLGWVENPAFSPDECWIAYVRVSVDQAANCYRRAIWITATDGSITRRLTSGTRSDSAPRWSPDSRQMVFSSNRDGDLSQLFLINITGGEARCLTTSRHGASDPAWSPDGCQIAFLAPLSAEECAQEDSGDTPEPPSTAFDRTQAKERQAHAEQQRNDPRVVTKLPYRSGTTYFDQRNQHIYIIDLPLDDETDVGTPRRLTEGELDFGPPVWSHDGQSLIATHGRDADADTLFGFDDLVRVPVLASGRATIERLTGPGFSYSDPQLSPDGRWIAAVCRDEGRPLARGAGLAIIPAAGGTIQYLTDKSDLNVEEYRWSPDSTALLFTAAWWGEQPVYRIAIDGSSQVVPAFQPAEARFVSEFDVGADGSIASIAGSDGNPCELYLVQPDGTELRVTNVSERVIAQRVVAPFEELSYAASDGQIVQGWVVYPPNFDSATPYPLAIHIHGGPHLMWAPGYRGMWHELQVNAARGYITFFCNPRGSDGYGEAWRDGVHGAWSAAADDILAGIELLIARGHVDTTRIAVTGGSYGGYMTAWLIAHQQRFACAVAARGVYDLISFHGTSDAHELIEFEFDGFPWQQHDLQWQQSPLAHAHHIVTPLLILHAELDWRVPISQAEQLFSNLRRRRIPVELVRYPREGHELTRAGEPEHRADHMRRTLEWFDRYCSHERT